MTFLAFFFKSSFPVAGIIYDAVLLYSINFSFITVKCCVVSSLPLERNHEKWNYYI